MIKILRIFNVGINSEGVYTTGSIEIALSQITELIETMKTFLPDDIFNPEQLSERDDVVGYMMGVYLIANILHNIYGDTSVFTISPYKGFYISKSPQIEVLFDHNGRFLNQGQPKEENDWEKIVDESLGLNQKN